MTNKQPRNKSDHLSNQQENNKLLSTNYLQFDEAFEKWRGNLEQLDDVCVIGVKI